MRDFKRLTVWQQAHQLTLEIYSLTNGFPSNERFGVTSQLRRSSASIPTNIAEGCGRFGEREFARFLSIASGSASETEYHLLLAHHLGYISVDDYQVMNEQVNAIKKMLGALRRKLTTNS